MSNPGNLVNPFANDYSNPPNSLTNPSPFKLFKSHTPTVPTTSNVPPSQPITSLPQSTAFTAFSSNNPFSQPTNPVPPNISSMPPTSKPVQQLRPNSNPSLFNNSQELEQKKNQMLNKKRMQDLLDEWKQDLTKNLQLFYSLAEKTSTSEKALKEVQKEVVLLQEYFLKIKSEQKKIEENIEIVLNEQTDLNGALDVIDRELDKVLQGSGLHVGFDDKENVYRSCSLLSKSIDDAEELCGKVFKQIECKNDDEDSLDIEHTIDIFLETLDWIERTVEKTSEKLLEIEKKYSHFRHY